MSETAVALPAATSVVRCADFTRSQRVDPGGTALAPEMVVLVEAELPWPKPVAKHDELRALVKAAAAHVDRIRVLAAEPHDPRRPRLIAFGRTPTGMTRAEVVIGPDPVGDLEAILAPTAGVSIAADSAARTVLICTQRSHDVCCGSRGTELADWADRALGGTEVFRVSHTGGHRFAPTAMTLPDGRMWAYLTPERLQGVIDRSMEPVDAAPLSRGWWGAATGPPQVAERAVFAELGWDADVTLRTVEVESAPVEGPVTVRVDAGVQSWEVVIEPGRHVPSIACQTPGGLPAKSTREWRVVRLARG